VRVVAAGRRPAPGELRRLLARALLPGALVLTTLLLNDPRALFLAPAVVNAVLLVAFARTLFGGPTQVESFARMQGHELSDEERRYCRSVTLVWCAFFLANGAVSLWLALAGDPELWALYTGPVAYGVIGLLFAGEFVVRSWRFGRYEGTIVAPLFRRLLRRSPAK
jgi:uncharacterized membrane protein